MLSSGLIYRLTAVSDTCAAAERPKDKEGSAHDVAARNGTEKSAVLAEARVIAEHEVVSFRNGIFRTVSKSSCSHTGNVSVVSSLAGVDFFERF